MVEGMLNWDCLERLWLAGKAGKDVFVASWYVSCHYSFGHMTNPERRKDVRPEDLAKASLVTVTNNIAAIARMSAMISVSKDSTCVVHG